MLAKKILELEKRLGLVFCNKSLLEESITHPSASQYGPNPDFHYQRLEFIGDAVLSFFLADRLYSIFPQEREGVLTHYRSYLSRGLRLATIGKSLGLSDYIQVGSTQTEQHLAFQNSVLENAVEALFGAIYLDQGLAVFRKFAESVYEPYWCKLNEIEAPRSAKTTLQELVQDHFRGNPLRYELLDSFGLDHQKQFKVAVLLGNRSLGTGTASSKKRAEEKAAEEALRNKPLEWKE